MKHVYINILLTLMLTATECKSETCSAGELMNGDGTCSTCPPGTFMSQLIHTYSSCIECDPKEENVSVHYPCNATHNTGCPIGKFQSDSYPLICLLCQVCKVHEAKPCSPTSDAICCGFKNMTLVKKTDDGVPCKHESSNGRYCCELLYRVSIPTATTTERMQDETSPSADSMKNLTCSWNTYIDQSTNSCKRCEPCSYIDQEVHSQQYCALCSSHKPKSRRVYCPKHCDTHNKGGLGNVGRVLMSLIPLLLGMVLLFVMILVSFKVISRCKINGPEEHLYGKVNEWDYGSNVPGV